MDFASLMDGLKRLRKKAVLALRAKDPGLKPIEFIGFFQGAEAPCSLRNAITRVFQHPSKAPFTLLSLRT
jgi:hypothetical protein